MNRHCLRKIWLAAVTVGVFGGGSLFGEAPAIVLIREAGRPDHRCVIEESIPQRDGRLIHIVRDLDTGERLRVVDGRSNGNGAGPLVGKLKERLATVNDAGMTQTLSAARATLPSSKRTPTTADLASGRAGPKAVEDVTRSAFSRLAAEFNQSAATIQQPTVPVLEPSVPVHPQLAQLRHGSTPALREAAAMELASSDVRNRPEIVQALMQAAKADPSAVVRACGVRCLLHISRETPEVASVIKALQSDPNIGVAETARQAAYEIEHRK